ncbi:class I SAM-dependent methyltransferase, partial [bacterium]|nr:class I SAM-dependent methyltransferase [bacterium]
MRQKIKEEKWVKLNQKTYEKIAPLFKQTREKKDKVLDLFFTKFKPKGRLMEVGCGSCRTLEYLDKQNFFNNKNFYLGIDFSKNFIQIAAKNFIAKKYPAKIKLKKIDLENLNFKKSFDWIIALAVLHHFPKNNLKQVLEKIKKSLKDEGQFAGYLWHPPLKIRKKWKKIGEKEYLKFWGNNKNLPLYYYFPSAKEIKCLFKKAGFKNIHIQKIG